MPRLTTPNRRFWLAALALCLAPLAGCALDQWPRIDPSGEQILIFPGETPPVAPGQPLASTPILPPTQPAVDPFTGVAPLTAPPGNLTAPPVYEDQSQGFLDRLIHGPRVVGPVVATDPFGQPVAIQQGPRDHVKLTPERVLAPVGSEVVLRAGVCRKNGYLETNQRIEWALGQQGVGQFVQLGDDGETDVLRWPWQRPNKIDNNYAIGYTTPFHTCLRRSAADPADDVQIQPGDAWISVTSAAEGLSHVTAYAPGVDDWAARKASAVIYWVDAQWTLPPSVTIPAGQPHTLTTFVTRQSDGAPIAGYIVRYEVVGQGGARLGYEAGQTTEATTDGQGRASVEISPTDSGPGAATVNITIVRPETPGQPGGPQVNLGTGSATVTWATDAPQTGLPPIAGPDEPAQPPIFEQPIDQGAGPISPQPAGLPNLVVQLRRDTQDPVRVGDKVAFTILVRNSGDGYARNLVITDRFDRGMTSEYDARGRNEIVYEGMSDLAPGESDSIKVEFDVLEAGVRQQEVTASATGATQAYDRITFTAQPIRQDPPELRVEMVARPRYVVGDVSEVNDIRGVVENTGTRAATNVVVRLRHDATLQVLQVEKALAGETFAELPDGYQWTIASLAPGQKRTFRAQCQFQRPATRSCLSMFVSADGGAEKADEACFEIMPRIGESPAEGGGGPGPGPASGLSLSMASVANPAQVGRRSTLQIYVVNNGTRTERQVVVELALPPGAVQADMASIQAPTAAQLLQNGVIQFAPIAELPPGGRESILVPYAANTQGRYNLQTRVSSAETSQPVATQTTLEIRPR